MIQCFSPIKTRMTNLAWLTQKTEESKCNKGNFTPPPHTHAHRVNAIELYSTKKVATPHFYISPQFLEGHDTLKGQTDHYLSR